MLILEPIQADEHHDWRSHLLDKVGKDREVFIQYLPRRHFHSIPSLFHLFPDLEDVEKRELILLLHERQYPASEPPLIPAAAGDLHANGFPAVPSPLFTTWGGMSSMSSTFIYLHSQKFHAHDKGEILKRSKSFEVTWE
jgi:hypothetical protein